MNSENKWAPLKLITHLNNGFWFGIKNIRLCHDLTQPQNENYQIRKF